MTALETEVKTFIDSKKKEKKITTYFVNRFDFITYAGVSMMIKLLLRNVISKGI